MTRIAALTTFGFTLAAVSAALAFGAGSQASAHSELVGTVGKNDAYKISLVTPSDKTAKMLTSVRTPW